MSGAQNISSGGGGSGSAFFGSKLPTLTTENSVPKACVSAQIATEPPHDLAPPPQSQHHAPARQMVAVPASTDTSALASSVMHNGMPLVCSVELARWARHAGRSRLMTHGPAAAVVAAAGLYAATRLAPIAKELGMELRRIRDSA
jgi:hypothetical protein